MIKQFVLACCLGAAVTAAQAQPPQMDNAKRLEHMQTALQLSDAQVAKLKPILDSQDKERKALADKYKISEFKTFRAEMEKLRKKDREEIEKVLTPAQVAAEKELFGMRKHCGGHGRHGMHKRPDGPPPA